MCHHNSRNHRCQHCDKDEKIRICYHMALLLLPTKKQGQKGTKIVLEELTKANSSVNYEELPPTFSTDVIIPYCQNILNTIYQKPPNPFGGFVFCTIKSLLSSKQTLTKSQLPMPFGLQLSFELFSNPFLFLFFFGYCLYFRFGILDESL